jgi:condensin complex subunit 2
LDYIDTVLDVGERQRESPSSQAGGRSDPTTNFQLASNTLDASVKIYACRVDNVHNEAFKVLGGLSRSDKQITESLLDQEVKAASDDSASKQKLRKRVCETMLD